MNIDEIQYYQHGSINTFNKNNFWLKCFFYCYTIKNYWFKYLEYMKLLKKKLVEVVSWTPDNIIL